MITIQVSESAAKELFSALQGKLSNGSLPVPVQPEIPTTTPVFDSNGELVGGRAFGSGPLAVNLYPVVPKGTRGTVQILRTGHVLSMPRATDGIVAYVMKVCDQAGGNRTALEAIGGAMIQGIDVYFGPFGGFNPNGSNWPDAVDLYYNNTKQSTDDAAAWAHWDETFRKNLVEPVVDMPDVLPTPYPPAPRQDLLPMYTSVSALTADARAIGFRYGISVNGAMEYAGFGPAVTYIRVQGETQVTRA